MSEYTQDKKQFFNWLLSAAAGVIITMQAAILSKLNQLVTADAVKTEQVKNLTERTAKLEVLFLKPKETAIIPDDHEN